MQFFTDILPWVQAGLGILLVITILLQQTGAGVGGAFGGGDGDAINYTRRGFEKFLFQAAIVIAIVFTLSIIASMFV